MLPDAGTIEPTLKGQLFLSKSNVGTTSKGNGAAKIKELIACLARTIVQRQLHDYFGQNKIDSDKRK